MTEKEILVRLLESFRRFPAEWALNTFSARVDATMAVQRNLDDLLEHWQKEYQDANPHIPRWRSAGTHPVKETPVRVEDMAKIGIP